MFAAVVALAALVSVAASEVAYLSSGTKALHGYNMSDPMKYVIPAGQNSGEVKYLREYYCERHHGPDLPRGIKVEVNAVEGIADIHMRDSLSAVTIYRQKGILNEEAVVYVSLACPPDSRPKPDSQSHRNGRPNIIPPVPSVG